MAAKGFAKLIIVLTTVTAAVMELVDTSMSMLRSMIWQEVLEWASKISAG